MNTPTLGHPSPLGASIVDGGVNFSLFSRTASGVELLLFERTGDAKPFRVVALDPVTNRTYHYWHTFVPGVRAGQIYGYRVQGPFDPAKGLRFDSQKVLLDPYGRGVVVPPEYSPQAARRTGDNASSAMKSVVVDNSSYDWEGDTPLCNPSARTIIYKMHVRGFTRHPNSGVKEQVRGTYARLAEKIPYLKDLGITAVELLPVHAFDTLACPAGLVNYWGYRAERFEDRVRGVDAVFDAVGGDTLRRSWGLLRPGGQMVTIAASEEGSTDERTQAAFFIVEPRRAELEEVARLIDAGDVRPVVGAEFPLADALRAYQHKPARGKVVLRVGDAF